VVRQIDAFRWTILSQISACVRTADKKMQVRLANKILWRRRMSRVESDLCTRSLWSDKANRRPMVKDDTVV